MNNDIFLETASTMEPSMYMTGNWNAPYKVFLCGCKSKMAATAGQSSTVDPIG